MSVDPTGGPAYEPNDPGFSRSVNPDGGDAGPLYLSPDAERWVNQNVTDRGYVIDWGTREIIDPETGESKGSIPSTFDRMI